MHTINLEEIRRVHRLAEECRERGDDVAVWMNHFVGGLQQLLDVDVVASGHIAGVRSRRISSLGLVDTGWEGGFDRSGWYNGLSMWMNDPNYSPLMNECYQKVKESAAPAVVAPHQIMKERDWQSSAAYHGVINAMGCEHHLGCMFRIDTGPDDTQTWVLNRRRGARNFNEREHAVLTYLAEVMAPLIGRELAGFREIRPTDLAPRSRQVLVCILEGDGDKQIAERLKISRHTVNEHTKTIYRHFGVSSRTELMARWIKRGWGSKFAWRSGPDPIVHLDSA